MNRKFYTFLSKFAKNPEMTGLCEAIRNGYRVCCESIESDYIDTTIEPELDNAIEEKFDEAVAECDRLISVAVHDNIDRSGKIEQDDSFVHEWACNGSRLSLSIPHAYEIVSEVENRKPSETLRDAADRLLSRIRNGEIGDFRTDLFGVSNHWLNTCDIEDPGEHEYSPLDMFAHAANSYTKQ